MGNTAKQKLYNFITSNGWVPDPAETIPKHLGGWNTTPEQRAERVQSPHAFMRPATFGGNWHIHLEYNRSRGSYSRASVAGNTLQAIHITHQPVEGEREHLGRVGELRNVDNRSYARFHSTLLWNTLRGYKPNGDSESLIEVAHKLLKDPETAIWLAIQTWYDGDERERKAEMARRALAREQARPLPIEIEREEWNRRVRKLVIAAKAVYGADGTSDLAQLVTDATLAVEAIKAALDDQTDEVVDANLAEAHHKLNQQDQEALKAFLQTP